MHAAVQNPLHPNPHQSFVSLLDLAFLAAGGTLKMAFLRGSSMATASHTPSVAELLDRQQVHFNLDVARLVEHAIRRGEGKLAANGALVATTGKYTGRSPKDKFVVQDALTADKMAWGTVNQPFDRGKFSALYERVLEYLDERELFVQDLFCGADTHYRLPVRFVNEFAWHNLFVRQLFVRQLFVRPSAAELREH